MSSAHADRNLLFGILALQADLIDPERLAKGCALWAAEKARSLADVFVEQGWLTPGDRADVEKLVRRKLAKHGGDAKASLAEVASEPARRSLAGVADDDVRRSLAGAAPPPAPGHVLLTTDYTPAAGERYTLSRLHASGGIGRVWLARDASLGRDVALKELRPERAANPSVWARFLREAQVTGQLEHPGIVPVYEVGRRPDDAPFYTMRFVRGRTLAEAAASSHERRKSGGAAPADLRELLTAFVGVCNAVAYAHSRGVLHRDLKPQNVVLGDFGEVIVLDWGLAKVVGEGDDQAAPLDLGGAGGTATVQGQVVGTPAYMPPEQAEGRLDRLDARSDVYGLGAILYEILSGRPPFSGPDTTQLLRRIIHEPIPPPASWVAGVPRALEAVCLKALAKNPADRYSGALGLAREVERWLADEPVAAYAEPWATRAARWGRRHRPLVTGAVAVLLAAVVALSVGDVLLSREQEQTRENFVKAQAAEENAKAEAARARRAVARVEAINRFFIHDLFALATPQKRGPDIPLKAALDEAAQNVGKTFAGQPPIETSVRQALGHTYLSLGLYAEAEAQLLRALDLCRHNPEVDPVELPHLLADVGQLRFRQARLPEAEALCREAIEAGRRLLGWPHKTTLTATNVLARVLSAQGKPAEAEPLLRHVADAFRHFRGPEDLDTLEATVSLGMVLQAQGKPAEAEPVLGEVLAVLRRVHGTNHPLTLIALHTFAQGLKLQGKLAEAEPIMRQTIEAAPGLYGPEHPEVLMMRNNLARLLLDLNRLAEAEPLYRDVLRLRRKVLPAGHAYVADSLLGLGETLIGKGAAKEAEPHLREALDLRRQALPRDHWLIGQAESVLGSSLSAQARYAEAEPLLLDGYERMKAAPDTMPARMGQAADRIIRLYEAWGKPDQAAAWRTRQAVGPKPGDQPRKS
jgi:eukaryotic-like serine/threonine-protein kinase